MGDNYSPSGHYVCERWIPGDPAGPSRSAVNNPWLPHHGPYEIDKSEGRFGFYSQYANEFGGAATGAKKPDTHVMTAAAQDAGNANEPPTASASETNNLTKGAEPTTGYGQGEGAASGTQVAADGPLPRLPRGEPPTSSRNGWFPNSEVSEPREVDPTPLNPNNDDTFLERNWKPLEPYLEVEPQSDGTSRYRPFYPEGLVPLIIGPDNNLDRIPDGFQTPGGPYVMPIPRLN